MSLVLYQTRRRAMIRTLRDSPEDLPGRFVADPPGHPHAAGRRDGGQRDGRPDLRLGPGARSARRARSG